MAIIIGSLDCIDPRTGEPRLIATVSGSPEEATAIYEVIRPHLNPAVLLASPVELPKECECVVPRLYAQVRSMGLIVHGMTLGVYGTGERIQPCRYCRENSDSILNGIRLEQGQRGVTTG